MDVQVKSGSGHYVAQATLWVYSLDLTTVLGPFTVNRDNLFATEIDYREWGVLVESEDDIIVDVWIIGERAKKLQGMLQNNKPAIKQKNKVLSWLADFK